MNLRGSNLGQLWCSFRMRPAQISWKQATRAQFSSYPKARRKSISNSDEIRFRIMQQVRSFPAFTVVQWWWWRLVRRFDGDIHNHSTVVWTPLIIPPFFSLGLNQDDAPLCQPAVCVYVCAQSTCRYYYTVAVGPGGNRTRKRSSRRHSRCGNRENHNIKRNMIPPLGRFIRQIESNRTGIGPGAGGDLMKIQICCESAVPTVVWWSSCGLGFFCGAFLFFSNCAQPVKSERRSFHSVCARIGFSIEINCKMRIIVTIHPEESYALLYGCFVTKHLQREQELR